MNIWWHTYVFIVEYAVTQVFFNRRNYKLECLRDWAVHYRLTTGQVISFHQALECSVQLKVNSKTADVLLEQDSVR